MAILLSAHQLKKSFASRPLFEGLTFSVETGERIGLIGPNGAGKSTLLRILAQQISPDEGTLSLQRGLRVGFLEQTPTFRAGVTVQGAVNEAVGLNADAAHDPAHDWAAVSEVDEVLSKLSLDGTEGVGPETPVATLSGGWKKRVALARELARKPDLLLLDEPTNHLDVESILWLEELLRGARFATLTITHDRLFLQKISNRILELDRRNIGGLLSVQGDYACYLETKEQLLAAQERQETTLKNTLRRETEWLRRGAKARTTKQQARIQRAETLGQAVEELVQRNVSRVATLEFQGTDRSPKKLVEAKGVAKALGGKNLFSGLDLILAPGSRLGLLGPNGCGKSTLIRVLVGQDQPDEGEIRLSDQLQVAYFEQNRETLDSTRTVLKTVCPDGDFVSYRGGRIHVRSYLDRFLFTYGQMEMDVGKLSGGEQSRLLLAQLMLKPANLLVLDEPTNDLDMATLGVLEDCLADFPGAVVLVTHDRYFLDQVCERILAFPPFPALAGPRVRLEVFTGLAQWEDWHEEKVEQLKRLKKEAKARQLSALTPANPLPAAGTAPAPIQAPVRKRKLSFKEQRELDSMESNILALEQRLEHLTEESQKGETAMRPSRMSEIASEMAQAHAELDRLFARWAELEKA